MWQIWELNFSVPKSRKCCKWFCFFGTWCNTLKCSIALISSKYNRNTQKSSICFGMPSGFLGWKRKRCWECCKNVCVQEKCYNQQHSAITTPFEPTTPLHWARVLMRISNLCLDGQAGIHNILIQPAFRKFRKERIVNE